MPSTINTQTLCRLVGAILISVTISLTGCATMRPNAESEESFMPDWGDALRMPDPDSELTGFSKTSRQIERNLGVE